MLMPKLIPRSGVFAASRRMKARLWPHGSPGDAKHHPETALTRLLTMRVYRYLYESGSGESDGLANTFFSSALIGVFRFSPLGGTFCVNHLS
jgi:hypothetical protein